MKKNVLTAIVPFLPFWFFPSLRPAPVRARSERVLVVASLLPGTLADFARSVTVVTRDEIDRLGATSIADVLKYCVGLDVQERGPNGAQADLSIRGATFQQVLVLVDGSPYGDLQTGHHNLDAPVPTADIERVEILRGPGSALFGPGALGGLVNIVTRTAASGRLKGELRASDFRTTSASLAWDVAAERISNVLSLGVDSSDGFIADRDYKLWQVADRLSVNAGRGRIEGFAGFGRKEFGALDFYTPGLGLPSREWTRTAFAEAKYEGPVGSLKLTDRVYFRSHFDRFILDRRAPSYYLNETTNTSWGTNFILKTNDWAVGLDAERGAVDSSKIGRHADIRAALFAEYRRDLGKDASINFGLRQDYHATYGASLSPSVAVQWRISPGLSWRASVGHSFRAPSYTELYYRDPANEGNAGLAPETAWSADTGCNLRLGRILAAGLTVFFRAERNAIDWIRRMGGPWRAENIRRVKAAGLEFDASVETGPLRLGLNQTFMAAEDAGPDVVYKYGFRYPQSQGAVVLNAGLARGLSLNLRLNHKKRLHQRAYAVLDASLTARIPGRSEIFLEAANLLNAAYEDIPGVRLPGRWVGAGLRFDIR